MKLDEIDRKIIEVLQLDGRITNAKLASIIGISPPATLERVRTLELSGIISQYVALVDREKVDLGVMAIVAVSLSVHELRCVDGFREKMLEIEEVLECHQTSGQSDFMLKVALESIDSYSQFAMHKLFSIPGIRTIKSYFILSTIKNSTRFPIRLIPKTPNVSL
jgi:Lrp/AsnC family transcriptional regulator, leucine-responsive regulatory protein